MSCLQQLVRYIYHHSCCSCYKPCSSHHPYFGLPKIISGNVQTMKLLVIQQLHKLFPSTTSYFLSLRSKYSRRPALKYPQSVFFSWDSRRSFTPVQHDRYNNYSFMYFNIIISMRRGDFQCKYKSCITFHFVNYIRQYSA